jgi:two-component system NtrC family sensor kinase
LGDVTVQKHLVLQILVNLIRNAENACEASAAPRKRLTLGLAGNAAKDRILIEVRDNGIGISPANLGQVFIHGFTTREDGHGFGLHSGAHMAKEMGGSLTAHSEGAGKGASFILEIPCQPVMSKARDARMAEGEAV